MMVGDQERETAQGEDVSATFLQQSEAIAATLTDHEKYITPENHRETNLYYMYRTLCRIELGALMDMFVIAPHRQRAALYSSYNRKGGGAATTVVNAEYNHFIKKYARCKRKTATATKWSRRTGDGGTDKKKASGAV